MEALILAAIFVGIMLLTNRTSKAEKLADAHGVKLPPDRVATGAGCVGWGMFLFAMLIIGLYMFGVTSADVDRVGTNVNNAVLGEERAAETYEQTDRILGWLDPDK